jgi:pimeloyl-ACP methyl ester carboxylesterase
MNDKNGIKRVWKAGFTEKNITLPDGTFLNYGESPANGKTPLLLIHGQTGTWENYWTVLPALAKDFHIFAIDCHGHGKSCKNAEKYKAKYMGRDFIWFIENIIGGSAVVSGHSSGGLLAAWIAANAPQSVKGVLLEDPPFFSTEKGERWEKSFAYVDTYEPINRFLSQSEEKDWVLFYLKNAYWGKLVGEKGMNGIIKYAVKYRKKHPNKPLRFFFLPNSINSMFWTLDQYDLLFGKSFYDSTWFDDFDQSKILSEIKCPAVIIHTKWSVNDEGILMAAMSGEDAQKAHELLKDSEIITIDSGHNSHYEKPDEFISAMKRLISRV